MPDYVYVVHHFQPENDDELGLQAGERVEVIEKDDEFGDGWWQVRIYTLTACLSLQHRA